jgi:hypothetical protein
MPFSKQVTVVPPPRATAWAQVETWEAAHVDRLGFDGAPWASPVYPAYTPDAAFSLIDTRALPTDVTPLTPQKFTFDLDSFVYESSLVKVRFVTAGGAFSPFGEPYLNPRIGDPLRFTVLDPVDYLPAFEAVGAVLRARTKSDGGQELGTFTTQTRPTADQVGRLITLAAAEVTANLNRPVMEPFGDAARSVIALRTAMHIEVSYFPEDTESRDSAFARLSLQYDAAVAELSDALLSREVPIV